MKFETRLYLTFPFEFVVYLFWLLFVKIEQLKIGHKFGNGFEGKYKRHIRKEAMYLYRRSLPMSFKQWIYSAAKRQIPNLEQIQANIKQRRLQATEKKKELKKEKYLANMTPVKNGNKRIKTRRKYA